MKARYRVACAFFALACASATPAWAQTADPQTDSEAPALAEVQDQALPDDIIVTATRRAERLADVPIAVSALTSATLQNSGADDIRQLNQVAPSLLVSSTGSDANTSARIRGVGTVGDNPGLESSVAVFIDGVYRSRTGVGLNDLGPLDRIEVLRGPQGTLFGRNASAGLLNIVTAGPEFDFSATGEATYGNFDSWRVMGGVTGPVSKSLALRLDALYSKRDGFYRDVNTGEDVNNRNRYLIRGQALFEPNSDLKIRIIGDYSRKKEACCGAVYLTSDINGFNTGLVAPSNPIVPVLLQVANTDFAGYFPSFDDPYDRRIATSPNRSYDGKTTDWGVSGQLDWQLGDVALTSITAYRDYKAYQAADADYGLADILYFGPGSGRQFKTFSQELRLQGKLFNDKLDWLVGGYFADEKLRADSQLEFGSQYGAFASCRLLATISGAIPRDPTQAGCLAGPGGAITSTVLGNIFGTGANQAPLLVNGLNLLSQVNDVGDDITTYRQKSRNYAFFTHDIIHVLPTVDLTLGLRYTNETKTFRANYNITNTICPQTQALMLPYLSGALTSTVPTSLLGGVVGLACQGNTTSELNGLPMRDKRNEDKLTGTAVLSWKPTDGLMVYASYSRGYKSGGFNLDKSALKSPILPFSLSGGAATVANLQFGEETVDAFEIGAKLSRRGFNLNVAAFRQEFSNFQLNTFDGSVYIVQNINGCKDSLNGADRDTSAATGACDPKRVGPGLVAQGVEMEAALRPARDLSVALGVTYADTRYADDLVGTAAGAPLNPALRLLPGQRISNAPEWVATSSLTWTPPIGGNLHGLFYVDSRLSDGYNTGSDLFPQKFQQSFVVVNGRVGIRGPDEKWAIELWGQNLFNAGYMQVGFSSPFQAGGAVAAGQYPAASYPGANQIFSGFLAEPRTYGVTVRGRF